jgi:hypothetical protein
MSKLYDKDIKETYIIEYVFNVDTCRLKKPMRFDVRSQERFDNVNDVIDRLSLLTQVYGIPIEKIKIHLSRELSGIDLMSKLICS